MSSEKEKKKLENALHEAETKNQNHAADELKWNNRQKKAKFLPKKIVAAKMAEFHKDKKVKHAMKYFAIDGKIKDLGQETSTSHDDNHNH